MSRPYFPEVIVDLHGGTNSYFTVNAARQAMESAGLVYQALHMSTVALSKSTYEELVSVVREYVTVV